MNDSDQISKRAWDLLVTICQEIGPRPAGSQAEADAQRVLASSLEGDGWSTEQLPFSFPRLPAYQPYLAIIGVFFLLFGAFLPIAHPLLIASPFLVAGLPFIYAKFLDGFNPHIQSQNLLALPAQARIQDLQVILCAHVDTARNQPEIPEFLKPITSRLLEILEVVSWIIAFLSMSQLLRAASWLDTTSFLQVVCCVVGILLLGMDLFLQLGGPAGHTRGADDNASGAALASVLAFQFQKTNPQFQVGLLLTGAEEPGLFGSKAAAVYLREKGCTALVINLDMVGHGSKIGYVVRAGRLAPSNTDIQINHLIRKIEPGSLPIDYKYRGGDFLSFLRAGFRSISLEMTENGGAPPHYHQQEDTPDTIQPEALEKMTNLLLRLFSKLRPS
jgi:hypothetical protein